MVCEVMLAVFVFYAIVKMEGEPPSKIIVNLMQCDSGGIPESPKSLCYAIIIKRIYLPLHPFIL